jgi:hypothetical protein
VPSPTSLARSKAPQEEKLDHGSILGTKGEGANGRRRGWHLGAGPGWRGGRGISKKFLAIAVFYSRNIFSPQYLFLDMLSAQGISSLMLVEKLGDYSFKLEFNNEEEKKKVLGGRPWRHEGNALIVAHYNRFFKAVRGLH